MTGGKVNSREEREFCPLCLQWYPLKEFYVVQADQLNKELRAGITVCDACSRRVQEHYKLRLALDGLVYPRVSLFHEQFKKKPPKLD